MTYIISPLMLPTNGDFLTHMMYEGRDEVKAISKSENPAASSSRTFPS